MQAFNKVLAEKKEANAKKTEERRQRHLQEQAKMIKESQVGAPNKQNKVGLSCPT